MDSENTQRQSPPVSASGKPLKPRKFRSSCDACSASKVKCDQGQPQCLRCINIGVQCNYSPSRRMGKPPASSRKLTNTSKSSNSSTLSNPSSSDTEQSNPAKKRQLSPPSYIASPPLNEKKQPMFEPSLMETDDFMAINWQDDLFQPSTFDGPATANIQLGHSNIFDLNFDFMGDSTTQLPTSNHFIFGDDSSSLESSRVPSPNRTPSRDPIFDPFQNFPPTMQSSPSLSSVSPRSTSTTMAKPKLCTHNLDLGNISTPSPITHTDASIDQVLIKNKAAIEKADALLACSCSSNPHFALTLALTCIKILGTYEDIIKAVPASAISPISGRRRSGSPIQISVGAYKMDAEDEERMRVQIVVNELRKVRALVDKYAKKYCGPNNNGDGIYSALEVFLRSKLTSTLHDLVTKLEC